jgi:hypothetical protein
MNQGTSGFVYGNTTNPERLSDLGSTTAAEGHR